MDKKQKRAYRISLLAALDQALQNNDTTRIALIRGKLLELSNNKEDGLEVCHFSQLTQQQLLTAWSNGICRDTLRMRIDRGIPIERAITQPLRKQGKYAKYTVEAEKNGISTTIFYKRVKKGWSPEDASTKPVDQRGRKFEHVPVELYRKAKANNIKATTFRNRVKSGWSPEDAATKPVRKSGRPSKHRLENQS